MGANKNQHPEPPPFPFTVEKFVSEVTSNQVNKAAQACAAFATLASQVPMVPSGFKAAVPAVVTLLTRREDGFDAMAVKESATAALSALLATLEGASEIAVQEGMVGKLLGVATGGGGGGGGGGSPRHRTLDLNALECYRILATDDAGAASLIADDDAMAFVTARCGGGAGAASAEGVESAAPAPAPTSADAFSVSESAVDVLCVLASKKTDGGASHAGVVRAGGVTALAKALVSSSRSKKDEVTVRTLLGLAMTTSGEAQQHELVGVAGAVPAVMGAMKSRDQAVAGISKDLWGVLGRNQGLKPALAAALRTHMEEQQRLGAVDGLDAA